MRNLRRILAVITIWTIFGGSLYLIFGVACPWFTGMIPNGEWKAFYDTVVYIGVGAMLIWPTFLGLITLFAFSVAMFSKD